METPALPLTARILKPVIATLAVLLVLFVTFRAGVFFGYRKASFSYRWSDNYHKMFAGPPRGFFNDFEGRDFIDGHGIFGEVLKIEGNTLIIKDKDETEKNIIVTPRTTIRRDRDTVPLTSVSSSERIVVIGSPNDRGEIDAKLIRIVPVLPSPPPFHMEQMPRFPMR